MLAFFRYLTEKCKGALISIFIAHTFTFVPAAFAYAFREKHAGYFMITISVSLLTSLIIYWSTIEFYEKEKRFFINFLIPLNIFFFILYFIFVFETLTVYYSSVKYFASIAEIKLAEQYIGPNRLLAFIINLPFYNALFIKEIYNKAREFFRSRINQPIQ